VKRLFIVLFVSVLTLMFAAAPALAYDYELVLENKDPSDWNEIDDGTKGILKYNSSREVFSYALSAKGLEAKTEYSLIYYADDWPGNNPGALIAEGKTNKKGKLREKHNTGEVDLNMSLPHPDDANYPEGAKIWLVPSDCYDADTNSITTWSPSRFLFEHNLITYVETRNKIEARWDPDRFVVTVAGNRHEWHWEGGFRDGRVLRDEVKQAGTVNGCSLLLVIPDGTIVNEDIARGYNLRFNYYHDRITVKTEPSTLTFSQTGTLYRLVDGDWEEVASFTELSNGQQL